MADGQADVAAAADGKNGKEKQELANNALVAGIVSAIVAGLISLLVVNFQDQDAVSQVRSEQLSQAAGQLETAADTLYLGTTSVYNFQLECASARETWEGCASLAPGLTDFSTDMTTFDTALSNIADQAAAELANQFANDSAATIAAPSVAEGKKLWPRMVTLYLELIRLCGQLIQRQ